jgi:hypothetical protein
VDEQGGPAVVLEAAGTGKAVARERDEVLVARLDRVLTDDRSHPDPAIVRHPARHSDGSTGVAR